MKNWKTYSLSLMLAIAGLLLLTNNEQHADNDFAFSPSITSCITNATHCADSTPCEEVSFGVTTGLNNLSHNIDTKDLQKMSNDSLCENSKIEREGQSYLFYNEGLVSAKSLCALHRLNI